MIAGLARPRMATRRDRLVAAHIFDNVLALQLLLGTASFGRNALFYSLVFLHALAALGGFGSIGFAGTYAANAYLPDDRPQGAGPQPASPSAQPASAPPQLARAPAHLASAPVQTPDGTAEPEPAALGPADVATGAVAAAETGPAEVATGAVGPAETGPAETGPAETGRAVPDYETALINYQAALREFETSDQEEETSGDEALADETSRDKPSGDEAPGSLGPAPGTVDYGTTGLVEQVPSDVEEVVVAEVTVQARPATSSDPGEPDGDAEELRRYFARPARLWGFLVLVPFLGAGALAAQPNGKGLDQPWVFGALAVWLAATLVAGSLVVPSLHQMQAVLLKSDDAGASPAARSSLAVRFARAGRIASRSAAFCDILFLVALALMIFRP
jgi:hypothetical protein